MQTIIYCTTLWQWLLYDQAGHTDATLNQDAAHKLWASPWHKHATGGSKALQGDPCLPAVHDALHGFTMPSSQH